MPSVPVIIGERALRQTVQSQTIKEFKFARYESPTVLIKNETDGGVLFCDTEFNEEKAYRIPARSWQVIDVTLKIGEAPTFSVLPETDGHVEIDFGSPSMGAIDVFGTLDRAGMIPHVYSVDVGTGTTLTSEITRVHGSSVDLVTPVEIDNGATVYNGDVIKLTAACTVEGSSVVLTVNGEEYTLSEGVASFTVNGDSYVATEAVAGD